MWDFLNKSSNFIKENGSLLQGIGSIASAFGAYRSAKEQAKANERNYQLNLSLLNDERRRQNQMQNNLNLAWASANIDNSKKDEYEI